MKDPKGLGHRPELDGLRAVAVLAVVCYHAAVPAGLKGLPAVWAPIGARGVDLFFVLSGFCLSWPYALGDMRTASEMATFFRRRLTRIAPTCWVALALFVALSLTPFGLPAIDVSHVSAHRQLVEVARDAAFFPTLTPIHDPPMWTLGIEMRWYVLFVPLLLVFHRSRVAFVAIAAVLYYLDNRYGIPDFGLLPTFMSGIVAAALTKARWKGNVVWPIVAIVALGFAVRHQLGTDTVDHNSVLWILSCFATVTAVSTSPFLRRCFAWPPLVAIGVASYSIYLVHAPFMNALAWIGIHPVVRGIVGVATGLAFWYLVERPLCSARSRFAMEAWMLAIWHRFVPRRSPRDPLTTTA